MRTLDDFLTEASMWAHFKNAAARVKTNVVRRVLPSRVKGAIAGAALVGRSMDPSKSDAMKARMRQKARDWATKGVNFGQDGNYRGYRKLQERNRLPQWDRVGRNTAGESPVHAAQNVIFHGGGPHSYKPPFPRSKYPHDDKADEETVKNMAKDKKPEKVALSSLRTRQAGITPGKVKLFMRAKNISGGGIHLRRRPDGTHDIIDGNHRASAARLRGDSHIHAYVHD